MSFNEIKQHGTEDFPFQLYPMDKDHPKYVMVLHWHKSLEIIRVLSGTLELTLNTTKFTGTAGDVFLVGPDVVHGAVPRDCQYDCLVFDAGFLKTGNRAGDAWIDSLLKHDLVFLPRLTDPETVLRVNELFGAMDPTPKVPFAVIGTAYLLFSELLEKRLAIPTEGYLPQTGDLFSVRIKNAITFMRNHYQRDLSLEEIATAAGISTHYFGTRFRLLTGKTPIGYLNEYRVERAARMLLETDCTVTQIAFSCGFNDLSYFIKTFRACKGVSAGTYRKQNR